MFFVLLLSSLSLLYPYYFGCWLFSCLVVVVKFVLEDNIDKNKKKTRIEGT